MSVTTFSSVRLDDAFAEGEGERRYARLRRELGVQSFDVYAVRLLEGEELLAEHDELGPGSDGHEKVWLVLSGHAVFTVDGEEIDAPPGTVIRVPHPEARRSAVAREPGTTLLSIGGRPGEPYRETPGQAMADFYPLHAEGDYEAAAEVCRDVLGRYPGNGLALFNLGCCEALLGRTGDAIGHVRDAIDAAPSLVENARTDSDLDSLRGEPAFAELIA